MKSCIRKNGGTCSAVDCTMRRGTNLLSQVKMFSFPRDPVRRRAWTLALRRKNWAPTNNSLLCSFHFISGRPSSDPSHSDYVPSIFSFNKSTVQKGEGKLKRFQRTVHARVSAAFGNTMGKPTALKALDQDWVPSISIGLANKSSKEYLCKTYLKNDVSCLNSKGETSKQKKMLQPEKISMSIPETASSQNIRTLLNCSDESSESSSVDNICAMYTPIIGCLDSRTDQISETNKCTLLKKNTEMNLIAQQNLSFMKENFTYQYLLQNLPLIKKPNVLWGITPHSNVIICARWSENYTCEKKVVIENTLNVRAFLKEWEIHLSDLMNITCINDISNLLEKVESYKIVKFKDL